MKATSESLSVVKSSLNEELSVVKSSLNEELSLVKSLRDVFSKELGAIKSVVSEEYKLVKKLAVAPADPSEKIFDISYTFDSESDTDNSFIINYDSSISTPCFYHSINNLSIRLDDLDINNKIYTGAILNYTQSGNLKALVLDNIIKPYFIKASVLNLEPMVVYHFPIHVFQYMSNEVNTTAITPLNMPTVVIYKDGVVVENQFDVSLTNSSENISSYDCTITSLDGVGGEYTLSLKIGEVESNQLNFSTQSVVIESPINQSSYSYLSTLQIIVKNVFVSDFTCKLKKTGDLTYETLTCTHDSSGTIISTKTFSSTDVGEYEFLVSIGSSNLTHYFTVDLPYDKEYEKLEVIHIHYDTTFKNNTTDEVITKVTGDTFTPSAGNYSWTLDNGLEGTFIVSNIITPRVGEIRLPELRAYNGVWYFPASSSNWETSTKHERFVITFQYRTDDRLAWTKWNPTILANDTNFGWHNHARRIHNIKISNSWFQECLKGGGFADTDFNHSVYIHIISISIKYDIAGLWHWTEAGASWDSNGPLGYNMIDIRNI